MPWTTSQAYWKYAGSISSMPHYAKMIIAAQHIIGLQGDPALTRWWRLRVSRSCPRRKSSLAPYFRYCSAISSRAVSPGQGPSIFPSYKGIHELVKPSVSVAMPIHSLYHEEEINPLDSLFKRLVAPPPGFAVIGDSLVQKFLPRSTSALPRFLASLA